MLHTNALPEGALALLNKLMDLPVLRPFSLVGGSALALKFGHRISEDIDLFTETEFGKSAIDKILRKQFGSAYVYEETGNPLDIFCYINRIKIDIVKHQNALIKPLEFYDNIRMYSNEDIGAVNNYLK